LFYFVEQAGPAPGAVMAVAINAESSLQASAPEKLFEGDYQAPNASRQVYDVSLDNQRFLMIKNVASDDIGEATRVIVVENWFDELRRLVPTN
jgi:hypothetical protein